MGLAERTLPEENVRDPNRNGSRSLVAILVTLHLLAAPDTDGATASSKLDAGGVELFEKAVRPILAGRCGSCHGAGAAEIGGGLRLDSAPGILRGGSRGPALVPGKPDESLIIQALKRTHPKLRMPPDGALSPTDIGDIELWIRMGAPDPRAIEPPWRPGDPAGTAAETSIDIEKGREFWSFQPLADPAVPDAVPGEAARSPIDRFLAVRRRTAGLEAAPPAEPRALIRRVTFDLTGLPPEPEEVEVFVSDRAPDAFERLTDRLLGSWAYGERLGRLWLDLVRYADTSGCNSDVPIPDAYRYRNWVIEAINADLPYESFAGAQIAGDLLPWRSEDERADQIIATGYLAISRRFSSLAEEFHLTIDDTIDNLGKAFLGLSLGCARCHDHKFDPVSMRDYYALYGIFQSTRYSFPGTEIPRHSREMIPLVGEAELPALRPFLERLAAFDRDMDATYAKKVSLDVGQDQDRVTKLWKDAIVARDEIVKSGPSFPRAYGAAEGDPADSRIQLKGDPKNQGAIVPRGFPAVLGGMRVPPEEKGSGRLQLARWLTGPGNALAARVIVNRIWQHHFGVGLVRTPDDFGARGEPPTHPELLDWLASRFLERGGSLKPLHRLILASDAYRMACREDPVALARDPENRTYWRFPPRRLEAEELRDAMLSVGGALDRSVGGAHPFKPEWEWRYTQHHPFVDDFPTLRRSVYLLQQRIRQHPYLGLFDGADTNAVTGKRAVSTTPGQALFLMNSSFAHEQAERFAERIRGEARTVPDRIDRAYRVALGRPVRDEELSLAAEYIERCGAELAAGGKEARDVERLAWASFLRVLLSSNEFAVLD